MPDDTTLSANTNTAANGATQAGAAAAAPVTEATPPAPPVAAVVDATKQTAAAVEAAPKTDETKAVEKPADAPVVYDLKPPEGSMLNAEAVEHIKTLATEMKLTPEQAQRFVVEQDSMFQDLIAVQLEQAKQTRAQWVEAAKADKEIGGAGFDASLNRAKQAFAKFGTPEFQAMLDGTGFGDNPEVLRVFSRIGKAMGEDTFANSHGTSAPNEEQVLRQRYPSMYAGKV